MPRGDSAIRLLKVIMYLETHPLGLTIKEIHSLLNDDGIECSERTVYRDLEVIGSAHFPLTNELDSESIEESRRWKFSRTTALSEKVHFENHEIFALYLARENLKSLRGSPLIEDILKMTQKLERALGPAVEKEMRNMSSYVSYKAIATWQTGVSQEILDTVYSACWENLALEVEYKSKSGDSKDLIKSRKLGPETLYFAGGGAYLIAKDLKDGAIKTYSLSRIVSAACLDEEYKSQGFDLEKFVSDRFGIFSEGQAETIKIHVIDPIASFVAERRWHDSQTIKRRSDGIELSMRVRVNDEISRWILGLGPSATVLEPVSLKLKVETLAAEIFKKYQSKKAS